MLAGLTSFQNSFAASSKRSPFQEAPYFHNRLIYLALLAHVSKSPTGKFYFISGLQG